MFIQSKTSLTIQWPLDQDCTILSGDVIIRHLAQLLSPKYVVFLVLLPSLLFMASQILSHQWKIIFFTVFFIWLYCLPFNTENLFVLFFHWWAHFLLLFLACFTSNVPSIKYKKMFRSFLAIDNCIYMLVWKLRCRQMSMEYMIALQLILMQYFWGK